MAGRGPSRSASSTGARSSRIQELRQALSAVQPVEVTGNIFGFLWAKMALGAVYFATAITDRDVTDIYADRRLTTILGRLAGEVVAVGEAQGIRFESVRRF